MSMETDLYAILKPLCDRSYPDIAPESVATPYVVWQQLGGASVRYIDGTPANARNPLIQISAWSTSRATATALIRSIEDALCASSAFLVEPAGEPASTYESDTKLYGSIQRFSIWSSR